MASIKLDRTPLTAEARNMKNAEEVVRRAQFRAINKVAAKTLTRSRREIVSRVNLTNEYVRERMGVTEATASRLEAIIYARIRPTRLSTYGAKQLTKAAPDAKGDRMRGIAAGRKQAGVSVMVKKANGRKKMRGAFLIPLRAGKVEGGNGMGLFLRYGKEIFHEYGFSVDQVFRYVINDIDADVRRELAETVEKQTAYEVRKALKL